MARLSAATSSQGLSQSSYVRGTYLYMAPEQWENKAVPASDQYALAILAFHLLTGQFPFQGSLSQVIRQHYKTPPPAPSSLNPQLNSSIDRLIQRALAKEPAKRFPSILDFAHAFAPFQHLSDDQRLNGSSASPNQISTHVPKRQSAQRSRTSSELITISAESPAQVPSGI